MNTISSSNSPANPLLIGEGLPPFERIRTEDVEPAITQLLAELEASLNHLEATVVPTWEGLVVPLEKIEEQISWSWGIVGHLMGVKNSPELRQAYEKMQPEVVKFWNRLSQSKPIYEGFKTLRQSEAWATLEPSQQRIVIALNPTNAHIFVISYANDIGGKHALGIDPYWLRRERKRRIFECANLIAHFRR